MARKWWQFTDLTGNEVEEWPAGELPNACTVFRAPWLNQFVGWKSYLAEFATLGSSDPQISYYENTLLPDYWVVANSDSHRYSTYGLHSSSFWTWLATLKIGGAAGIPEGGWSVGAFNSSVLTSPPQALPYYSISPGTNLQSGIRQYLKLARDRFDMLGGSNINRDGGRGFTTRRREWSTWYEDGQWVWSPPYERDDTTHYSLDIAFVKNAHHLTNFYVDSVDTRWWKPDLPCNVAFVSTEDTNDPPGGSPFPMPQGGGYCHAILERGESFSVPFGLCTSDSVDPADPDFEYRRMVALILIALDELPPAYRAQDWPGLYSQIQWSS